MRTHTLSGIVDDLPEETAGGVATLEREPRARYERRAMSALAGAHDRGEQFDALERKVRAMSALPINWDLYGGRPAESACIEFAVHVLRYAMELPGCPIPTISPISGGVFIDWNLTALRLYFEADKDSVLAVSEDGQSIVAQEFGHQQLDVACGIINNFVYGLDNAECVY